MAAGKKGENQSARDQLTILTGHTIKKIIGPFSARDGNSIQNFCYRIITKDDQKPANLFVIFFFSEKEIFLKARAKIIIASSQNKFKEKTVANLKNQNLMADFKGVDKKDFDKNKVKSVIVIHPILYTSDRIYSSEVKEKNPTKKIGPILINKRKANPPKKYEFEKVRDELFKSFRNPV
jgi:hypothetical protein